MHRGINDDVVSFSVPYELSFSVAAEFPLSVPPLFHIGSMRKPWMILRRFISTALPLIDEGWVIYDASC